MHALWHFFIRKSICDHIFLGHENVDIFQIQHLLSCNYFLVAVFLLLGFGGGVELDVVGEPAPRRLRLIDGESLGYGDLVQRVSELKLIHL